MSAMDPLADQDKLRKVLSGQSMELCNFLQNVVAITYIFGLQQPTFLLCNFLHLYFATNTLYHRARLGKGRSGFHERSDFERRKNREMKGRPFCVCPPVHITPFGAERAS
jgi:hypothetical protein